MCGIAGVWFHDGRPVRRDEIQTMTRMLAHRGPDGEGIHLDGSLGLGHRRLSILDLSGAGSQPMSYADGRYWIVFNGEIYNFIELRAELAGLGHSFKSDSDTEVILAAYLQWGAQCQLKFNGMWAFAIWDRDQRRLFLSRDRFGVKPLHWYYDGKCFAFASEMKSFLPLECFQFAYDPQIMARALADFNTIEGTEDCLLRGVKRLMGGHCAEVLPGQPPKVTRWWSTLSNLHGVPPDISRQAEEFRMLFFDACNIRMRSDVPIGTALSGGLDSSSVLCTLAKLKASAGAGARHPQNWQTAFVATFPGTVQDERHYAEEAVRHAGANGVFREMNMGEGLQHLDEMLFAFEEVCNFPGPAWLLYREMRKQGIVVSLDGHGCDELLGGYHFYVPLAVKDAEMTPFGEERVRELKLAHDLWVASREYPEIGPGLDESGWIRPEKRPVAYPEFMEDQFVLSGFDALTRNLYFDFHYRCLPTILRNFDRVSMASGVEIRAPFMDWRLVCYCFSLPCFSKLGRGFFKLILRLAMIGVQPDKILNRVSKLGFVSPMSAWADGPLKPFLMDTVSAQDFLSSDIVNGPAIRNYVEQEYKNGTLRCAGRVWDYVQAFRIMKIFHSVKAKQKYLY